ncbi:MAG: hypothetical protein ABJP77_13640 [Lentilitoribacter sp.]
MEMRYFSSNEMVYWTAITFSAIFYVFVYVNYPIHLLEFALHDDGLFLKLGISIINGEWLGAYDNLTLAKGPGYPLFLAFTHLTGLPISFTQAVFHMSAAIIFGHALGKICNNRWISITVLLFVSIHPYLFGYDNHRVFRDAIYWAQCMGAIGWLIYAITIKRTSQKALYLGSMALAGLYLSFAWITREETIWLVPGVLLVLSYMMWTSFKERAFKPLFIGLVLFLTGSQLFILPVRALNYYTYGYSGIVDFKDSSYSNMIAAINAVKVGDRIPFVPAPIRVREEIAKHSPTFAKFDRHLLPGGKLFGWSNAGCPIYPSSCGEIAGGWYIWGIRDALAMEGAYESFQSAKEVYGQITHEVLEACDKEKLNCEPGVLKFMPPFAEGQWNNFFPKFIEIVRFALFYPGHDVSLATRDTPFQVRKPDLYSQSLELLNHPVTLDRSSKDGVFNMTGWYYTDHGDNGEKTAQPEFRISAIKSDGSVIKDNYLTVSSPDIVNKYNNPEAHSNRFSMSFECRSDCVSLRVEIANTVVDVPMPEKTGWNQLTASTGLKIDALGYSNRLVKLTNSMHIARDLLNTVRKVVYNDFLWLILSLSIGFSLFYLCTELFVKKRITDLTIVVLTLWGSVFVRAVLLTLVGISSFPVINYYVAPVMILLIPTMLIGLYAGCLSFRIGIVPDTANEKPE